jgi:thiamine phosphate synthase YjbQ (UPF0047 family)
LVQYQKETRVYQHHRGTGARSREGTDPGGLVLASAMHITAAVYINDAEDGLIADIAEWLEKLAPFREDYRHHRTGEDNGDAQLKNLLIGHQVLVGRPQARECSVTYQAVLKTNDLTGRRALS